MVLSPMRRWTRAAREFPNVDAIAEFSVEMNFSAENGRDPMQVKSGDEIRNQ